jgi:hypothetical protein
MNKLLAEKPADIIGTITAPSPIEELTKKGGAEGMSIVINNGITLLYQAAIILFVFMILISALQWITSGGEKEKIASAKGRLTSAIIGLVILGLAWVIVSVLGTITGIKIIGN